MKEISISHQSIPFIENLNLYETQAMRNPRQRSSDIMRYRPCYSIIERNLNSVRMSNLNPQENSKISNEIVDSYPIQKSTENFPREDYVPEAQTKIYIPRYRALNNKNRRYSNSYIYPHKSHVTSQEVPNQIKKNSVIFISPKISPQSQEMQKQYVFYPRYSIQNHENSHYKVIQSNPIPIANKPITSYIYSNSKLGPDFEPQYSYPQESHPSFPLGPIYYAYYKKPRRITQAPISSKTISSPSLYLSHTPFYYEPMPELNENESQGQKIFYESTYNEQTDYPDNNSKYYPISCKRFYYY